MSLISKQHSLLRPSLAESFRKWWEGLLHDRMAIFSLWLPQGHPRALCDWLARTASVPSSRGEVLCGQEAQWRPWLARETQEAGR